LNPKEKIDSCGLTRGDRHFRNRYDWLAALERKNDTGSLKQLYKRGEGKKLGLAWKLGSSLFEGMEEGGARAGEKRRKGGKKPTGGKKKKKRPIAAQGERIDLS